MNLTNEIKKIVNGKGLSDDNVYELVKTTMNEYKRLNSDRKTYNIVYTDKVANRNQLSYEINILGKTIASINTKLYNIHRFGFSASNEDLELTEQICKALETTREKLVVDFPLD